MASSPEPWLALRPISVANALAGVGVMVSTTFAGELSPRPDELVVPSVPMPMLLHRCQPSPFPDYADDTTQHVGVTHSRASSGATGPPAGGPRNNTTARGGWVRAQAGGGPAGQDAGGLPLVEPSRI